MRSLQALSVALLAAGAIPVLAHHSFAVFFDAERSVKVSGVVQEFQFRNPHGLIRLTVAGQAGEESWKAETNSPSILERRGWKRDSVKVGDTVTIEGWPARDGTHYLRVRAVLDAAGKPIGTPLGETAGEQK